MLDAKYKKNTKKKYKKKYKKTALHGYNRSLSVVVGTSLAWIGWQLCYDLKFQQSYHSKDFKVFLEYPKLKQNDITMHQKKKKCQYIRQCQYNKNHFFDAWILANRKTWGNLRWNYKIFMPCILICMLSQLVVIPSGCQGYINVYCFAFF